MPFPACAITVDDSAAYLNEAAHRLLGIDATDTDAEMLLSYIHYDDRAEMGKIAREAVKNGTPVDRMIRLRGSDGRYSRYRIIAHAAHAEHDSVSTTGGADYWFCHVVADAASARDSLDLLGLVNQTLTGTNYPVALETAFRLIARRFCDVVAYFEPGIGGVYEMGAAIGVAPEFRSTLGGLFLALPGGEFSLNPAPPTQASLREYLASTVVRQELHMALVEHTVAVPVVTGDDRTAIVVFARSNAASQFTSDERRLAELLSSHIGAYAARMNTEQRDREIVHGFQRASLPVHLPSIAGYHFEGFYEFGASDRQFGGDWYDALRLADGRIVLSIGDVAGSGLAASVMMASMRQVIRGVAQVYADPRTILEAADRTLKNEYPDGIVTTFVGVLDPIAHTLTYMNAGHPHPYLRRQDGMLEELGVTGLPLGLRTRDHGENVTIEFYDKSMLVLYTDGLIEAGRDIIEGYSRFQTLLENASAGPRGEIATVLYHGMRCERSMDDVAIFVVTADHASLGHSNVLSDTMFARWTFDTTDEGTAARSRCAFAEFLRRAGFGADDIFASEIIFGELLSNVVRYANGPVEIVVDRRDPAAAVLHVLDKGPGFLLIPALPGDILSERGRGLFLIAALAREFNVTKRIDCGSHARAVLPGSGKPMIAGSECARRN